MAISKVYYETARQTTGDASKASAARRSVPAFNPVAELVKETRELQRRSTRHVRSPQHAPPTQGARREKEKPLPQDGALRAEKAAAKAEVEQDDSPAGPGPVIPSGPVPPDEQVENAVHPEQPGAGRDFKNRIDAAQGRSKDRPPSDEELTPLLEQAVTLLEALSNHPAVADYASLKQRLDNVEQILHSSGNVR